MFLYCIEIYQNKQDKLSPDLINFFCFQKNVSELLINPKNLITFLKIVSFGEFKYPLKKHFIKKILIEQIKHTFELKLEIK